MTKDSLARIDESPNDAVTNPELLRDAIEGLSGAEKTLPPKWLYDRQGCDLFERITTLPEYYPTRTEAAILETHAAALGASIPPGGALVELGSGASVKTRTLLDAAPHLSAYVPVDIAAGFLEETAADLRRRYPRLDVVPVAADFTGPVPLSPRLRDVPKVGFFPGSTIGNLEPEIARDLLAGARAWPNVEGFILGVDLVKDTDELVAAYDDAQGVTAAFIGNLLTRLNRETGADFAHDAFAYEASWNAVATRIDMRLVSRRDQVVTLPGARIGFAAGEAIHVSAARKYTVENLGALARSAGWKLDRVLTDREDRFAVARLAP
ncbi:L-histidine N(alpha)-methyltransferase [uncultured Jannaschia sp.]|uniref:L-histidine N(alpha)-methyltransferase n=1 Tax=uncultured Jannaschia sp. TaxID=293347 RepID=UPI00260C843E|nr:L-histidine N(alpha)-methyltransferase [uncultured Jannaschia sp.]